MKKLAGNITGLTLFVMFAIIQVPAYAQTVNNERPQLGRNSVQQIMASMTLEQKAEMVVGLANTSKIPEKVPGASGRTTPLPQFGIPSITVSAGQR